MSYFLKNARRHLDQGNYGPTLNNILLHLEEQSIREVPPHQHQFSETPDSYKMTSLPIPEEPASEKPSSVDTETDSATNVTLPISWTLLSRVSLAGKLEPSPVEAISALLNSVWILGIGQEVEIGVTLTSKGLTPPDGSH
jgi:hypothetical protein